MTVEQENDQIYAIIHVDRFEIQILSWGAVVLQDDQNSARSFDDLITDEFKLVKERREKFQQPDADSRYLTGLALSGGGIRSATYSLGFLQALSRLKIFPKIDYLSTVSGGSYIGSFFGALFLSKEFRGSQAAASTKTDLDFDPSEPLQSPRGLEAVRKLREAGRYLTPGGTSDAAFAAAVVARNWLALHIVLGVAVILMFWLTHLSDAILFPSFKLGPSPTLAIFAILTLVFIFGQAAAYWITSRDWIHRTLLMRMLNSGVFWGLVAASIGGILVSYHVIKQPGLHIWISNHFSLSNSLNTSETGRNILNALSGIEHIGIFVALSAGCAIISYIWAEHKVGGLPAGAKRNNPNFLGEAQDRIRGYLSRKLSLGLVAISALFVFAAMQWLGRVWEELLVENFGLEKGFTDWANLSAAILALGPPLLSYLASKGLKSGSSFESPFGRAIRKISGPLFAFAAIALLAAWLTFWSVVAYAGYSASQNATMIAEFSFLGLTAMTILASGALFFAYAAAARSFSFINLSSLATFYAARLKRAYIGASSREREHGSVTEDYDQDNISLKQYYSGGAKGKAPLHLINMTIAETVSEDSKIVAHDRKGKPMHLSPCGTVFEGAKVGVASTRAVSEPRKREFTDHFGEDLPLANWIAISGAAVSAAIGSGTSLAISILATLGNVRLGYWWKKTKSRSQTVNDGGVFKGSVQHYLFLELIGKFFGTHNKRWYLTDGGHFDNTGIYPLLQREVRFIVACDNGADPDYKMADVTRLLRMARTDLDAKINFLNQKELDKEIGKNTDLSKLIGPFADLATKADRTKPGGPISAIAKIKYGSGAAGILVLIKPKINHTEPPEVLAYSYQQGNETFPQQTTADQFFDEEQWEAYRHLGELAGEQLFTASSGRLKKWLSKPAEK